MTEELLYDIDFRLRGFVENLVMCLNDEEIPYKYIDIIQERLEKAVNDINDELYELEEGDSK